MTLEGKTRVRTHTKVGKTSNLEFLSSRSFLLNRLQSTWTFEGNCWQRLRSLSVGNVGTRRSWLYVVRFAYPRLWSIRLVAVTLVGCSRCYATKPLLGEVVEKWFGLRGTILGIPSLPFLPFVLGLNQL